jgi:hypothetical protein
MIPWELRPVREDRITLRSADGAWVVTDGGRIRGPQCVSIGQFDQAKVDVRLEHFDDGLASLTLYYPSSAAHAPPDVEIVIDSGYLVLCCKDAFELERMTDRESANLLKAVYREHRRENVVVMQTASGECVGLVVTPPYGDGAYALRFNRDANLDSLRIELENSQ